MSKKVIAINSSKRKGNTYNLIKSIGNLSVPKDIQLEIINLYEYDIRDCNGCEMCIRNSCCYIKDDVEKIMNKLKEADGIIISSPVYMGNVTGKLKTFVDRSCKWYHRPELVGKPALVITTTAASASGEVIKYMEKVCIYWGLHPMGSIKRTVKNIKEGIKEKEVKNFIYGVLAEKATFSPSLSQLINYQVQKVLALKVLTIDKEYWREQGWDNKIFYYDCNINPLKKLLSKSFFNMLYKKVNKVED